MEKFILKQLDKALKNLKQINEETKNFSKYDQDKLIEILLETHQSVISKEKPLNLFVKTLTDYMNSDINKNFKLDLLNDIDERLEKLKKKGLITFPDSMDWKTLLYFQEEVSNSLISNAEYVDFEKEIKDIYNPVKNIFFIKKYPKHHQEIAKNITNYFTQRINAEIVIPFLHYQVKYTWIKEKKPEDNFKPEELEEYFQSWVDLSVTHEDWLHFRKIHPLEHLDEYELSDEKLEEIKQHQFQLFYKIVNNVFQNQYKTPFENLPEKEAREVAKRDLELIHLLLAGNLNEANQKRVAKNFRIKNWQKAVLQFEDLLRNKYSSENNYDIHHEDSFLYPCALLEYKKYLELYIENQSNEAPKNQPSSKPIKKRKLWFNYTGTPDKLKNTLNALQKANAISNDIKMPQFKKLFSGKEVKEPVPWLAGKGDLMVFIQTIIETPDFDCPDKQQWNIAAKCFTKPDGSPFTPKGLKVKPTVNEKAFIKAGRNLN